MDEKRTRATRPTVRRVRQADSGSAINCSTRGTRVGNGVAAAIVLVRALVLAAPLLANATTTSAQGLPTQVWPAGTQVAHWNHGARISTYHRGYLYLGGAEGQATWTYDISDAENPRLVRTEPAALNGHAWLKVGDLWWRQYAVPELGYSASYPFQTLADPLAPRQQTSTWGSFPVDAPLGGPGGWVFTYPWVFASDGPGLDQGRIHHARIGWWPIESTANVRAMASMYDSPNQWRLGNLLFLTPSDTQDGVAVFDIGDPRNPVLLDRMTGNVRQYTTTWQVWRHYLVLMFGDNSNGPEGNANALMIDFSDPANLTIAHTIPYDDLPGRYAHFQDRYAFAGRFGHGTKYDLEARSVVRTFVPEVCCLSDFQWIPLGHLLLASGSEADHSGSFLFAHQDGLDTTRPTVGYHLPRPGAIDQPVETVVGLVINETLDSPTVDPAHIRIHPIGPDNLPGPALATTVLHTSYQVVNVVPDAPLAPDTTYEVTLVGNGVHDVAGNGIAEYRFRFATGASLVAPSSVFGDGFE